MWFAMFAVLSLLKPLQSALYKSLKSLGKSQTIALAKKAEFPLSAGWFKCKSLGLNVNSPFARSSVSLDTNNWLISYFKLLKL